MCWIPAFDASDIGASINLRDVKWRVVAVVIGRDASTYVGLVVEETARDVAGLIRGLFVRGGMTEEDNTRNARLRTISG